MDRFERAMRFAKIHADARKKAGKSQEYMALELNVSKKTVQNWESGASCPDLFASMEWFRALDVNPLPYYAQIIYDFDLSANSDTTVDEQFSNICNSMSTEAKKAVLYIMQGNHGSDPVAILQLMLAHLGTPMATRVTRAHLVALEYEMQQKLGGIKTDDYGIPDMEYLNAAISEAQEAAIQHKSTYDMTEKRKFKK